MKIKDEDITEYIQLFCPTKMLYNFTKKFQIITSGILPVMGLIPLLLSFNIYILLSTLLCILVYIIFFIELYRRRKKIDILYNNYHSNMKEIAYRTGYIQYMHRFCLALEVIITGFTFELFAGNNKIGILFILLIFMSILVVFVSLLLHYLYIFHIKRKFQDLFLESERASTIISFLLALLGIFILNLNIEVKGIFTFFYIFVGVFVFAYTINILLITAYIERKSKNRSKTIWELRGANKDTYKGIPITYGLKKNLKKTYYYIGWYEGSNFESTEKYKLRQIDNVEAIDDYRIVTNGE